MKIIIENNKDIKELSDHAIDAFLRGWTIRKGKLIWNEKIVIPEIINKHKLQWINASIDWDSEFKPLDVEYIYFNPKKFSLKRIDAETILIIKKNR